MNRILLEPEEIDASGTARLRDYRADHLRRVLRVEPGRIVKIGLLDGPCGTATVLDADESRVELRCDLEREPPPVPTVDLLLALPRPKVMKRLWAPLAALGVGRILLTNAARVERNYFDTHWLAPAHYRPLLIEGLQQAGDTRLPQVEIHRRFRPLVEDLIPSAYPDRLRLAADPAGDERLGDVSFPAAQRVLLAVGPEGGWVDFELELLRTAGFRRVRIRERILRSDTACIALLALLHERLDQATSGPAQRPPGEVPRRDRAR